MQDFLPVDVPPVVWVAGGALLALFVFAVVWKLAARLPTWARATVQLALIGIVLFPVAVLYLGINSGQMADRAPPDAIESGPGSGAGAPKRRVSSEEASGVDGGGARNPDDLFAGSTDESGVSDTTSLEQEFFEFDNDGTAQSVTKSPPPSSPPVVSRPEEVTTAAPPSEEAAIEDLGATRGITPTSPGAGIEQDRWTLVPVYYGTDRKRKDTDKRIGYDWQRGRRLELGRAMVSVPKDHVEPRIERPWAISIPFTNIKLYEAAEDPSQHFTVQEIGALSEEELLAIVKARLAASVRFKDHALVFVHGYQTQFDSAVFRTAQIAFDLKFDGAPFLYSWPSGGTLQGYTYDRESAAQAERYLRQFLDMVVNKTGAKKVSVIAHSMGNQPLLRVLQDFQRSLPDGLKLSQLILAAPDVDRDSFENIVSSITGVAEGITLYAASNDQALQVSRRVNGGVPRAGDVPATGPIIMSGVDTIDATATSMDSLGINHAGYAENVVLLRDIGKLIQTGQRPPRARVPELEEVTSAAGLYWRYPAAGP